MFIRTIRCCLCVNEATRNFFWEAMVSYTLLVNYLLTEIAKHAQFQEWQSKGAVPRPSIEALIKAFEKTLPQPLPARFCTSAVLMAQYVYKSWFQLQKKRNLRLLGKQRWLKTVESDEELARITDFDHEIICAKAQDILNRVGPRNRHGTNQQSRNQRSGSPLIGLLLDRFEVTDNLLERRAIIHLLKNNLAVSEQGKDPSVLTQQLVQIFTNFGR